MIRRAWTRVQLALLTCLISAGTALAADPNGPAQTGATGIANPGVRLGEWIGANVTGLFPPILAAVSLYYLMKRAFTQFISFAVFATVVALFVYAPDAFKDAAVALSRWVIGK